MGILKKIFYLSPLFLLCSCFETFDPKIDAEPVLCINSLIEAGKPIKVKVTHTWLYTDEQEENNGIVNDAVILIYVNDKAESLDYIPKEGDRIKIVAETADYGVAEAEVEIPQKPVLKGFEWEITDYLLADTSNDTEWEDCEMNIGLTFNLTVKITISDISSNPEYYNITFADFVNSGNSLEEYNDDQDESYQYLWFTSGTLRYDSEPLFFEHIDQFEAVFGEPSGIPFFTDKQFEGSDYTLTLQFNEGRFYAKSERWDSSLLDCGIDINLFSISKSYYDWEIYYNLANSSVLGDIINWGFADPVWGYSNVSTGAGVVAAESSIQLSIDLKDFFESLINNN